MGGEVVSDVLVTLADPNILIAGRICEITWTPSKSAEARPTNVAVPSSDPP